MTRLRYLTQLKLRRNRGRELAWSYWCDNSKQPRMKDYGHEYKAPTGYTGYRVAVGFNYDSTPWLVGLNRLERLVKRINPPK